MSIRKSSVFVCAILLLALSVQKGNAVPPAYTVSTFPQRVSDRFTTEQGLPGNVVKRLHHQAGSLYAETDGGLAVFAQGKWKKAVDQTFPQIPVDAKQLPEGAVVWSTAKTPSGQVWVVTDRGSFYTKDGKYVRLTKPQKYLTRQPAVNVDAVNTCVEVDSLGHVWLGTNAGIYATDGEDFWVPVDTRLGIPYEVITCLSLGKDGAIWAGTTEGVCRYTPQGRWQYYWGKRWLPDNKVNSIIGMADGSAWVATQGGVAHLYDRQITLREKANHYEEITARHSRFGFMTGSGLKKPGDPTQGVIFEASDNDGLWTSLYVGAEAYRYAVTKEPEARALAQKSMRAMLDLVKYTGVKGFPARSIVRKGEQVTGYNPEETVGIEGETEKVWYTSPIDPNITVKGDTSSDEMDGHYYAWYLYYELVADAKEKEEIRTVVRDVTDHILQGDLNLIGHTGRKTRWGVWNPKYVNEDPMWWEERGLNSLEILTFLKVAEHICGDKRFADKYHELITKHHYLLNTINQKMAEPWYLVNHSDDEMAFMMYYVLMDIEKEPTTRRILQQSLERSWKIERPEASPFFNFIYTAQTGAPADIEASVATLQDWAWELIDWEMRGTQRSDVELLRTERSGRSYVQTVAALPPSERRLMRWNGNPFECNGGSPNGASEEDAAVWLLPYWMGRYHGFIHEK